MNFQWPVNIGGPQNKALIFCWRMMKFLCLLIYVQLVCTSGDRLAHVCKSVSDGCSQIGQCSPCPKPVTPQLVVSSHSNYSKLFVKNLTDMLPTIVQVPTSLLTVVVALEQ